MSLNSLKIATEGYLKKTVKSALIIAVAGYLNYSSPVPPTPEKPSRNIKWGVGSGFTKHPTEQLDRIKQEDEELLLYIKIFLTCQS